MREVADRTKFERECRKTLARTLHNVTYLAVHRDRPVSQVERYVFTCNGASRAEAGDRAYSVVPFYSAPHANYWLAASVDLAFKKRCYLKSVSLVVFEGEASDNVKTPIMRAEWDSRQDDESPLVHHAQPHWHVYSSTVGPAEYASEGGPRFGADIQAFSLSQRHKGKDFHFAMASQWHVNGKGSHASDLEVDSLLQWLEGCLAYVREQLTYLHN
jgi:hypothetical protein